MKKLIMILIMVNLVLGAITFDYVMASDITDAIKDRCVGRWLNNYVMAEYCYKQQLSSMYSSARLLAVYDQNRDILSEDQSTELEIVESCLKRWYDVDYNSFDYVMVSYCIDGQLKAFNNMK